MITSEKSVRLTKNEFEELKDFIYRYCGVSFDDESKFIFEKRIYPRLQELNLKTFKDYIFLIKYDALREKEIDILLDTLITKETYFFREEYQLKAFTDEIIPEIMSIKKSNKERDITIWSAGCSTGEEPYTISILLNENIDLKKWDIEIIAFDINNYAIEKARAGVYSENSFRNMRSIYKGLYFDKTQDGKLKIKESTKKIVTFSRLNILDPVKTGLLKPADVIFCRNVLIYFDMETKKKAVNNFYNRMKKGGFILLGHAESLINISPLFKLRHLKNDIVYQKPLQG